jgi:hypothetical protein
MFRHKVLRINYTTYDMRRSQDCINIESQPDIMLLAPDDDDHPFVYARVIGIYHAKFRHPALGDRAKQMDFLFVRWIRRDLSYVAGWSHRRLHRVSFAPQDEEAFGFVDPREVVRAVHLIPAFLEGYTTDYLERSTIARTIRMAPKGSQSDEDDWSYFYVNW